jgi:hypothetical protein
MRMACCGLFDCDSLTLCSPFWNFAAIAASKVDKIITMDTYTSDDAYFSEGLAKIVAATKNYGGSQRYGVGLCTPVGGGGESVNITERFQAIQAVGSIEVDIWQVPIPLNWYPLF